MSLRCIQKTSSITNLMQSLVLVLANAKYSSKLNTLKCLLVIMLENHQLLNRHERVKSYKTTLKPVRPESEMTGRSDASKFVLICGHTGLVCKKTIDCMQVHPLYHPCTCRVTVRLLGAPGKDVTCMKLLFTASNRNG